MVGGVVAIWCGLALAGLAWGAMFWEGASHPVLTQEILAQWVVGSLLLGGVLLVGGARAPGAALVGSSVCSFLAYPLKRLYGGENLETLVHGAVILGSVGLVVFGLAGLRGAAGEGRRRRALAEDFPVPRVLVGAPLGRYPMALALAIGTAVVGTLLIRRIDAAAIRGFEDPWVQPLLAFNVAFLALLFLVQPWQASRSSGGRSEGPHQRCVGPGDGEPRSWRRAAVPLVDAIARRSIVAAMAALPLVVAMFPPDARG